MRACSFILSLPPEKIDNFFPGSQNKQNVNIRTTPDADVQLLFIQILNEIAEKAIHQIGHNTLKHHCCRSSCFLGNDFKSFVRLRTTLYRYRRPIKGIGLELVRCHSTQYNTPCSLTPHHTNVEWSRWFSHKIQFTSLRLFTVHFRAYVSLLIQFNSVLCPLFTFSWCHRFMYASATCHTQQHYRPINFVQFILVRVFSVMGDDANEEKRNSSVFFVR